MRRPATESFLLLHPCAGVLILAFCALAPMGCRKSGSDGGGVREGQTSEETPGAGAKGPVSRVDASLSVGEMVATAGELISAEKYPEARRLLAQALIREPQNSMGQFLLAQVEANSENLQTAIEVLDGIPIDDDQFGVPAAGQKADWLVDAGQPMAACQQYREILKLRPEITMVHHRLASLLNRMGWRTEAGVVIDELIRRGEATEVELRSLLNLSGSFAATQASAGVSPVIYEAVGPLPRLLDLLANGKSREATKIASQLQQARSLNVYEKAAFAAALAELQRFDELEQLVNDAPPEITRLPLFWQAIGDRELAAGNDKAAVGSYVRSLQLDGTSRAIHTRLVGPLTRLGSLDLARRLDDRRERIIASQGASYAIGAGKPDDYLAGADLVGDLEELGHPDQAAAWIGHISRRHPNAELAVDRKQKLDQFAAIPDSQWAQRRLGGINIDHFETPDFRQPLRTSIQADAASVSSNAKPRFANVALEQQISHRYFNAAEPRDRYFQVYQAYGAGIVADDFDCDGAVDFYMGQGGCDPPAADSKFPNKLYRNCRGKYVDVAGWAGVDDRGYAQGSTSGDLNQDGFPDIIVGNLGVNRVFINQGDGTFIDGTDAMGWNASEYTTCLAIADCTGDGVPDIVETNYLDDPKIHEPLEFGPRGIPLVFPKPLLFQAAHDRVWIGSGDGSWRSLVLETEAGRANEKKEYAQIGDDANTGLGLIVTNLDGAPGLEIFVANDGRPNQLWRLNQVAQENAQALEGMSSTESGILSGCAFGGRGGANACMGVACADFDEDGNSDLVITNWSNEWLNFFVQRSPGFFRDFAPLFGLDVVSEGVLGFGIQPIDFDNDSHVDLIVANGHVDDLTHQGETFAMLPQILAHHGSRFDLVLDDGDPYWTTPQLGRALIRCDHNADGKMDFVAADLKAPLALMENRTQSQGHWLQFVLRGTRSERDAIGARVTVTFGNETRTEVVTTGDGFECHNEPLLAFGLGQHAQAARVEVTWPTGLVSRWDKVQPDSRCLIVEGAADLWYEDLE